MGEKKSSQTTGANWLVLLILLVSTIIIALMWVMIFKLSEDKEEMRKQIMSSNETKKVLEIEVNFLKSRANVTQNEIDNVVEQELQKEEEKKDADSDKATDGEKKDTEKADDKETEKTVENKVVEEE